MTQALVVPWWVSKTAPTGWLNAWIAPRPFWNAVAPMLAAAIIWPRALQVAAVGVGAAQVLVDEAHPLQCDALPHGVIEGASNRPPGSGPGRPSPCPP